MPTAVPFPSPIIQPSPQGVAMAKEAHDPAGSSVTETSKPFGLKRHKHYYMSEGNIVIQVCLVASHPFNLNSQGLGCENIV